jgi:hypothetical protein
MRFIEGAANVKEKGSRVFPFSSVNFRLEEEWFS